MKPAKKYTFLETLPFRLGTTSYIIPDDILPNVRFLADRVKDVELVLFDVDEYCNIPDAAQIQELKKIAAEHDLSYTVHLPLDLKLSTEGGQLDASMEKALKVIEASIDLQPFSYTLHLDNHAIQLNPTEREAQDWADHCRKALEMLVSAIPESARLSVENLENYPPEMNHKVFDALSFQTRQVCSDCIDIGHLWLQKRDVPSFLEERLASTTVIHLHGIGSRDHQSLTNVAPEVLKSVLDILQQRKFSGVLTLEVFSQEDFESSMERIAQCL